MRKAIATAFVVSLLLTGIAGASGSSAPVASPSSSQDPYSVTDTLKCTVTKIAENGEIYVRDNKTEKVMRLLLTSKTKLTAQDKAAFDGRKKLAADDLAVGQELKITKRVHDGSVLRVKVNKAS